MSHSRRAFTLIELLVVIAIIAILAAILFPVFAQAKEAAKKTAAISDSKQMALGDIMYSTDSDDFFPISAYNENQKIWPGVPDTNSQLLLKPYLKNEGIMFDPTDPAGVRDRECPGQLAGCDGLEDPNLVPAALHQAQHDFNIGMTADWGINYEFINPVWVYGNGALDITSIPQTQVTRPANTILAISALWDRHADGTPFGGGNYGVDAPCILDPAPGLPFGGDQRPNHPPAGNYGGYYWFGGWNPQAPLAWNVFGGVWPWHGTHTIVAWVDGHVKVLDITAVGAGCNILPAWGGYITDESKYQWTLN